MTTAVSICSNALLRLGGDPISSFDEADQSGSNIERARLCANLWPTVRRQVLAGHTWNAAIKRVLISPDASPPAFGYAYRFLRPADWLRTIAVGREAFDEGSFIYRTESGYFVTDEPEFPLVYVFDNTNPATYDAAVVAALELGMAAVLAYPVTKSTSLASELNAEMKETLKLARAIDSQNDPPETFGDSILNRSRYGRSGAWGPR